MSELYLLLFLLAIIVYRSVTNGRMLFYFILFYFMAHLLLKGFMCVFVCLFFRSIKLFKKFYKVPPRVIGICIIPGKS